MLNVFWMVITVAVGIGALILPKKASESYQIGVTNLTFALARIFWGLEWHAKSLSLDTIILLAVNLIVLSVLYLAAINYRMTDGWAFPGWGRKNLFRNLLLGLMAGGLLFFIITLNKPVQFPNLGRGVVFSFLIASWQEENLFRGYLTAYLKKRISREEAVVVQALIYSVAHLGYLPHTSISNLFMSLIFAFIMGLVFGGLKEMSGSQIPGFVCHGLVDLGLMG